MVSIETQRTSTFVKYTVKEDDSVGSLHWFLKSLFLCTKICLVLAHLAIVIEPQSIPTILRNSPWALNTIRVLSILFILRKPSRLESFLVMKDFGIQVQSSNSFYGGFNDTKFFSKSQIIDIAIHEMFVGLTVKPVLVAMISDSPELCVVFPRSLPRLALLEPIYRETIECYYNK